MDPSHFALWSLSDLLVFQSADIRVVNPALRIGGDEALHSAAFAVSGIRTIRHARSVRLHSLACQLVGELLVAALALRVPGLVVEMLELLIGMFVYGAVP